MLRSPDANCYLTYPQFRAGGRLLVAEQCLAADGSTAPANGRHGASLLEYDPASGQLSGALVRLRASSVVTSLSVDASGQHVLVLDFPSSPDPGEVKPTAYALRDGRLVAVFTGAYDVAW